MKNAKVYSKAEYSLEEACESFVGDYVIDMITNGYLLIEYFDSVRFIQENRYLDLEEGFSSYIILSDEDMEEFNFLRGE